jgi:hypothetical protein
MAISLSGSLEITGSINATGGITGSFSGTATSASYALIATSASYAVNSDLLDGRDSLTFANTGSNSFVGTQNINGSVAITGSLTTTGAITAQTLNVQQVTSSIVYSSGSNVFGNSVSNTQSMTGSVGISGSLSVNGISTLTGALSGTSTSFSGLITSTVTADRVLEAISATTSGLNLKFGNTGGNAFFGLENSTGGDFAAGAYNLYILHSGNRSIVLGTNGSIRYTVNGSGDHDFKTGTATFGGAASFTIPVESPALGTVCLTLKTSNGANDIFRWFDGTTQLGVFKNSGNVGIGTTSPDVTGFGWKVLTIKGGTGSGEAGVIELQNTVSVSNDQNLGIIAFLDGTSRNAQISVRRESSTSTAHMDFWTNAGAGLVERMRITSGGNVGIGTASPTFKFDVETSSLTVSRFYSNATGKRNNILIQNSANFNYGVFGVVSATGSSNGDVYGLGYSASGSTAFTEVLNWTSGGNVGIGTSSPAELFQVTGGRIYANGTGTSSGITWNNYNIYQDASTNLVFRNGTTERMRIESGNNILLGNTVDTGIAVMVFGGGFANQTTLDTNYRFQGPNNSTTKAKAYAWDTYSDIRIKKDINTLDYGLTQILSLNPVSYNQYDSEIIDDTLVLKETYKATIGLIAQEVNDSIPESVGVGNDTELWGLDYTKLIPVLVKAIQEQQSQIEALKLLIK